MKRQEFANKSIALLVIAISVAAFAQKPASKTKKSKSAPSPAAVNPVTTNPTKVGVMYSTDGTGNPGTWVPYTGSGAAYSGSVQPMGAMVSSDGTGNPGTWVPATASTFGGGSAGLAPSGDTTGGTDCGNIQTACNAGFVQLAAAKYYVGKSNTACIISNTCWIRGQGTTLTTIQNEGSTNDVIDVTTANGSSTGPPYQDPFPSGGGMSALRIQQDPVVPPTAGAGLRVGTKANGPVTQAFYFSYLDIADTYYNLRLDQGLWGNNFTHMTLTNPASGICVYHDSVSPSGDNKFTDMFCAGTNSTAGKTAHWYIDHSDTNLWSNIKINNGNFQSGPDVSQNLFFVNIGVENGGAAACAFDFTNANPANNGRWVVTNLEFGTGSISGVHVQPYPICAPQNAPNLTVSQACVGEIGGNPAKCFNTPTTTTLQVYDNFGSRNTVPLANAETNTVQAWTQMNQTSWSSVLQTNGTNQLNSTGTPPVAYYLNYTPISAAYTSQIGCTLSTGASWCVVFDRLTSETSSGFSGYGCRYAQGVGTLLEKWTTGTNTTLGTTDTTVTTGTHMIAINSTLQNVHTCIIDGKASTTATATDATYTAPGNPGLGLLQPGGAGTSLINQPFTVQ